MGRKSLKEVRQKEIIKGFYAVAKKEGLENTSIAKVAESMQINPSLIIHYFKSKEGLVLGLIDYNLERYEGMYNIEGGKINSKEKLKELIDNLFSKKWNRLFDDGLYYSCYALTYRNQQIKEKYKSLHDSLRTMLKKALDEAEKNGIIRNNNHVEISETIFAVLEGAYYYLGMSSSSEEYDKKMELYKSYVLNLLRL